MEKTILDGGSYRRQDRLREGRWVDAQDAGDSCDDGTKIEIPVAGPEHRRQGSVGLEGPTEASLLPQHDGARIGGTWQTSRFFDDILGQLPGVG